ncbi:TRAP transporter small permease [Chloroflexota bacterium]
MDRRAVLGFFIKIPDWLTRAGVVVAGLSVGIMMCATCVDVTRRYVFGQPVPGVIEGCEILMGTIVFLGLSWTAYKKGHITLDVLTNILNARLRYVLNLIVGIINISVLVVLIYASYQAAGYSIHIGEYRMGLIPFPFWPLRIIVVIGFCFLLLQVVVQMKFKFTKGGQDDSALANPLLKEDKEKYLEMG